MSEKAKAKDKSDRSSAVSKDDEYNRARDRAVYSDKSSKDNSSDGQYSAGRPGDKIGVDSDPTDPNESLVRGNRPKNSGRGAAGRHQGYRQDDDEQLPAKKKEARRSKK